MTVALRHPARSLRGDGVIISRVRLEATRLLTKTRASGRTDRDTRIAKNHKPKVRPLHDAATIRDYLKDKPANAPVWGGLWSTGSAPPYTFVVVSLDSRESTQPLETEGAGASSHRPASSRTKLPGLDSNQDEESQNLLCYRYTTG